MIPLVQFHYSKLLLLVLLCAEGMSCGQAFVVLPPLSSATTISDSSTTTSLQAKRPKGFGSGTATASKGGFTKKEKKSSAATSATLPLLSESKSIQEVLNPHYKDPAVLKDLRARLRAGEVVILKDAFLPEVAETMHSVLSATENWDHNEDYFADGYHYRHFNIYDKNDFPTLCKDMQKNIFESAETKEFMTELTGRDCMADTVSAAPSYYGSGDHSLPHTDHIGQRSVAFIWHLAKDWRPEWGGAMYWAQEPLANAFHHASFNSLVLFSVTPHTAHFVTTVSPKAKEKRLGYNGWWHSDWVPTAAEPLEDMLATPEQRLTLTHAQILAIQDMLDDPWAPRIQPPERHAKIEALRGKIMDELYPPALSSLPPSK